MACKEQLQLLTIALWGKELCIDLEILIHYRWCWFHLGTADIDHVMKHQEMS